MKRCTKCILPDSYPGITFDNEGVCSYCIAHGKKGEIEYLGDEALVREMDIFLQEKVDRNEDYDCVIGLSGGRDSSYLLYYLVRLLKLRVFAYSVDNGFVPEQAKMNMKKATEILDVRLTIEENDLLGRCLKHVISSWMHRPLLAMIETFCTGCRFSQIKGTHDFVEKNRIPIIIWGGTPFERMSYRSDIMKISPVGNNFSAILKYLSQIAKNPRWIMNYNYVVTQIREYFYFFHFGRIASKSGIKVISPFHHYFRWKENEVISTIEKELDWKNNPDIESTWRADCDIALLKLYLYKQALGFNDKDVILSNLIRDNQIGREEALERLDKEGKIPEDVIEAILVNLGFSYSDFRSSVVKLVKDENR